MKALNQYQAWFLLIDLNNLTLKRGAEKDNLQIPRILLNLSIPTPQLTVKRLCFFLFVWGKWPKNALLNVVEIVFDSFAYPAYNIADA